MSDRLSTWSALSSDSGVQGLTMHRETEFEEGSGDKEACVAPRLHLPQVRFCSVDIGSLKVEFPVLASFIFYYAEK